MTRAPARRIRLFLDANVLISAAWNDESKVRRIWRIPAVELITSDYVLSECRRNLPSQDRQLRLDKLLENVQVMEFSETLVQLDPPTLPEKDQPVLAAAIFANADYLLTGDRKHFGAWYGTSVFGVRVEPPANFPEVLKE